MRKLISMAILITLVLGIVPAFALEEHNTLGVKFDAPNLVKLPLGLYFGFEGGKDIEKNAFYPDELSYIESDRGYFGYAKVTCPITIFDLSN